MLGREQQIDAPLGIHIHHGEIGVRACPDLELETVFRGPRFPLSTDPVVSWLCVCHDCDTSRRDWWLGRGDAHLHLEL